MESRPTAKREGRHHMPRPRKAPPSPTAGLAKLPHQADLVIAGGLRPLAIYIREGGETFQPLFALWMDPDRDLIRASALIAPNQAADGGTGAALDALAQACAGPFLSPNAPGAPATSSTPLMPALPSRVLVNDAALAEAARDLLAPYGVPVEHQADLPAFETAFASLSESLGADPNAGPPEPFAWEIDPAALPPLFKASAGYWRRAPWQYIPDHPPVIVHLGEHGPRPGADTLYASIMGLAGELEGIAFYYAAEALERMAERGSQVLAAEPGPEVVDEAITMLRQMGVPLEGVPPAALRELVRTLLVEQPLDDEQVRAIAEDSILFSYDDAEDVDPTYLEWLAAHNLSYPSSRGVPSFFAIAEGGGHRELDAREVRALALAIEAINQFFSKHRRLLETGRPPQRPITFQAQVQTDGGTVPVDLSYTPPPPEARPALDSLLGPFAGLSLPGLAGIFGEMDEEELAPERKRRATKAGRATLYRFQVKLDWMKSVWRRIELRGDQTLEDLHNAIQRAFNWDNDHLYAFFLSGKAWDMHTEYESPYGDGRPADRYRLEHLPLTAGQRILYIFDFGDELRHAIKLEAIVPGGVQSDVTYPRVTDSRGEPPPQYPDYDEEEEDELADVENVVEGEIVDEEKP
jgi:pRiA4b ORF-3-like protein/uncharacterized protein DUF6930